MRLSRCSYINKVLNKNHIVHLNNLFWDNLSSRKISYCDRAVCVLQVLYMYHMMQSSVVTLEYKSPEVGLNKSFLIQRWNTWTYSCLLHFFSLFFFLFLCVFNLLFFWASFPFFAPYFISFYYFFAIWAEFSPSFVRHLPLRSLFVQ